MKIFRISLGLSTSDGSKQIHLEAELNGEPLTDAIWTLDGLAWMYLQDDPVVPAIPIETGADVPDLTAATYRTTVNGRTIGLTAELQPGDDLGEVMAELKQKADAIAAVPVNELKTA